MTLSLMLKALDRTTAPLPVSPLDCEAKFKGKPLMSDSVYGPFFGFAGASLAMILASKLEEGVL